MIAGRGFAAAFAALMLLTASASAGIEVNFVNPDRFRDQDFRSAGKRVGILKEFRKYFDRLGRRYLREGQTLTIDVLNIDLAGRYEPWRSGWGDVRILRDVTPPSFKLRYTLRQRGKVIMSGEETVTDMTYLWNPSARLSGQRFAYEKDMLRDWFRKRFVRLERPRV